jgi:hypothetical protein
MNGIELLRADFSPEAPTVDVWADDQAATIRAREAAAKRAAAPQLPGKPVETTADGTPPPRSHAKERIVSQVRMRHLLRTISGLHFGELTRFRGDATTGTFLDDDGCGNFVLFAWNAEGLVGIGFDHDMNADAGADEADLTPEQYFPDLPAPLAGLLAESLRATRRHATGGLWVASGDAARWKEVGSFPDDWQRYTMLPQPSVFDDLGEQSWRELTSVSEAQAKLAIALATDSAAGPRVVTKEEEAILLRHPAGEKQPDPSAIAGVTRALAAVGVTWSPG